MNAKPLADSAEITYTIIIPHRNIPQLLQRCLDSIPYREDVQIIIVDDNSDPEMVDFNAFPGAERKGVEIVYTRESRICRGENGKGYFTKKGKGPGYARNVALQKAQGKWIVFADADDFFYEGMLQILDAWKDSKYDIVFFDFASIDAETLERCVETEYIKAYPFEIWRYIVWVSWSKLIRSELIRSHSLAFDERWGADDVMFNIRCGMHARTVAKSSALLYHYVVRGSSISKSTDYDYVFDNLEVGIQMNKIYYKHKIPFLQFTLGDVLFLKESPYYWKAWRYYLIHGHKIIIAKELIEAIKYRITHRWLANLV
ncbi:MAG: glycosyltransferase family 2 protein [Prevotellaceae bacterium]|jgi:glycosyltransferase involved in cell wall biosynthesis|nr:glycosyltransferase family 2 protein [Prevotellaceae bacterium]